MVKLITAAIVSLSLAFPQANPDHERRLSELEKKIQQLDPSFRAPTSMEDRLRALEAKIDALLASKAVPAATPAPVQALAPVVSAAPIQTVSIQGDYSKAGDTETRLPIAGYMDFHVNKDRGDAFRPDFHRFVLLFGHSFSNRIKFWSEFELEHSIVAGGEESGEIALEQAYLDFLIKPYLNLRAGMLLHPVGIINERHEPPSFNGVERTFVETTIIPTTWRDLGFGLTGDLGRGFRYRAYLTSSLDATFFDAENGITEGRTLGFDASMRNPAKVGRLEFAGVRRLTLGASFYSGHSGFRLESVNPRVTLYDLDARYSYKRFDIRGLFAHTWVSQAGELNDVLKRQLGFNPNMASQLRGWYVEPGVHLLPRKIRHDLIAFGRYEKFNTQHKMPDGYVPLPQFNRSSWVTGLTYKPHADVAIKFDYNFNRNASTVVQAVDGINLGIGWWF